MTANDYRSARKDRGTQKGVALLPGVDYRTVQRREAGEIEVTREASLVLLSLQKAKARRCSPNKKLTDSRGEAVE